MSDKEVDKIWASTFVSHPWTNGDTWVPQRRAKAAIAKAIEQERLRFEGELDKWMKILGAGISGYQPEAYALMDAACEELAKVRAAAAKLQERLEAAARELSGEPVAFDIGEIEFTLVGSPEAEEDLQNPRSTASLASSEKRDTFEIPEGFEAVRDEEGRATGEIRKLP